MAQQHYYPEPAVDESDFEWVSTETADEQEREEQEDEYSEEIVDEFELDDADQSVRQCPRCLSTRMYPSRSQGAMEGLLSALGGKVLRCHVCFRRQAWFGMANWSMGRGKQADHTSAPKQRRRLLAAPAAQASPSHSVVFEMKERIAQELAAIPRVPLSTFTPPQTETPIPLSDLSSLIERIRERSNRNATASAVASSTNAQMPRNRRRIGFRLEEMPPLQLQSGSAQPVRRRP